MTMTALMTAGQKAAATRRANAAAKLQGITGPEVATAQADATQVPPVAPAAAPALPSHAFEVRRNMRGELGAENNFELPNGYWLKISTSKVSGGMLSTSATCHKREGDCETWRMFTDFRQSLQQVKCRVDEKAVRHQHASCLIQLDAIKAAAIAHNATIDAKEANA